ncbi:MAG: glycosyltransferase family 2 protein [Synechococcaceae bacterium WB9_2_112]|nr:glycosyltransferase family 2 protein [Synechococcaceae bacterium WB9_2_112]
MPEANHIMRGSRTIHPRPVKQRQTIHILTVNYFSSLLVAELLESIQELGDESIEVVIVDNSPNDEALDELTNQFKATILRPAKNLGFGEGCNFGLRYIHHQDRSAVVWLLNPDTNLLPNATTIIRNALKNPPYPAILGTCINTQYGKSWFRGGSFNSTLGLIPDGNRHKRQKWISNASICEPSQWVSGCSMILDLSKFSDVPYFDKNIFLYYEDVDLCLRLAQQGHETYVTNAVLVEHAVSATTAKNPQSMFRHATFSKLYILSKHASRVAVAMNIIYFTVQPLLVPRGLSHLKGRLQGVMDFLNLCFNSDRQH